jgi:hypothetical protein
MEITISEIKQRIHSVRGLKIVLDQDLAQFYQTETKILNQAVRRNSNRFPIDFAFRLKEVEYNTIALLEVMNKADNRGGRRYLPYGFTQEGISMLSGVLNSEIAINVNILIMRAFVQLREVSEAHLNLAARFDQFENRCEEQFRRILENQRNAPIPSSASLKKDDDSAFETCLSANENRSGLNLIHQTVAKYFGISIATLKLHNRTPEIVLPRQIAIYLIRTHLGLSLKQIGRIYSKDHSTILTAYRKISASSETNPIVQKAIQATELRLKQYTYHRQSISKQLKEIH